VLTCAEEDGLACSARPSSSAREDVADRIDFLGRRLQMRKTIDPRLYLARGGVVGVERQLQHGRRERRNAPNHRLVFRQGEAGAEQAEIGKRILQQRVLALELLDQFLLPAERTASTSIAAASSRSEPAASRNRASAS
jgi:hypothetical protein